MLNPVNQALLGLLQNRSERTSVGGGRTAGTAMYNEVHEDSEERPTQNHVCAVGFARGLLHLENLSVSYGGIRAVKGISLSVYPGELICLIGANGAGKSTTLKAITGLQHPNTGQVFFAGQDITQALPPQRVEQGMVLVPEGRGIFGRLTVVENLMMGAYTRRDKAGIQEDLEKAYVLFPRLAERCQQAAGTLSGGEQQMLAVARAMMARPKLLLLDEPSMGLAPLMVQKILETIQKIAQSGVTILLVEQNAHLALQISQRAYVMESGKIILAGSSSDLLCDERIRHAYLGELPLSDPII